MTKSCSVLSNATIKITFIPYEPILYSCKNTFIWTKALYSTCMQHGMPQSLIFFAVSRTQGTLDFGTFGGVVH